MEKNLLWEENTSDETTLHFPGFWYTESGLDYFYIFLIKKTALEADA